MAIHTSPKWGKWGVGAFIPLALLLNLLQCLSFDAFCLFSYLWKASGASCRKGNEEEGIMSLF